jgi:hypothetical protein
VQARPGKLNELAFLGRLLSHRPDA